ncbi:MAG: ABC transporter permease [Candidatus Amulumruptor caecigallinarius]|nr:ABC transporter permease [Candidatus Amulumruptor caecigallinarius]
MRRSLVMMFRRPVMWMSVFGLPLFLFLFIGSMLNKGLPTRLPATIVDLDGTGMSRQITQQLGAMQMVDLKYVANSYSEARRQMQKGEIYGYFLIPENFQADLLSGRGPEISFYTNMTYYVPGTLLFKTFKTTAVYTKAGTAAELARDLGQNPAELAPMMQPVNIHAHAIGNPLLNYGIYLGNSFIPGVLQLMIMLVTVFTLGEEIKRNTSRQMLRQAGNSIFRAMFCKIFPQTVIWWCVALFMTAWLFKFNGYTMQGSWFWLIMSELLFVVATQAFAVFVFGILPNMRLALSVCALTGILSFSIAAFSFPEQSMYPAVSIFSWLMPVRYNFLIYSDVALNGRDIFYSRFWFVAYLAYMLLPLVVMPRIKQHMARPVYLE